MVDPADGVADVVSELTGGNGADVVIEFVGSTATMELSIALVGRFAQVINVGLEGGSPGYAPYGYPAEVELTTA